MGVEIDLQFDWCSVCPSHCWYRVVVVIDDSMSFRKPRIANRTKLISIEFNES